jgi:hypothetical protein
MRAKPMSPVSTSPSILVGNRPVELSLFLRRLVLAGLPALAACPASPSTSAPATPTAPLSASCQPRLVIEPVQGLTKAPDRLAIAFAPKDGRLADLYEACIGSGDHCARLCREVLTAANLTPPPGHDITQPLRCELGCDGQGHAVARIDYLFANTASIGRRPDGFVAPATEAGSALAAFFTTCATLEGASIGAFQILARELAHHGAPAALIARAQVASRDEARHFRRTARLAHQHGAGRIRCPRILPRPPRPLLELACENAREGCVGETFAAAVALHQALAAGDPLVRATMAEIAEDELAHALLAWDVDAWVNERLGGAERTRVAQARAEAGRQLLATAGVPVAPELVGIAGLPDAARNLELARAAQPLWA